MAEPVERVALPARLLELLAVDEAEGDDATDGLGLAMVSLRAV